MIESDSDDPEEQRKKIEAQQAASNLGAIIGITAGIIGALTEKEEPSAQEEDYKEFLARMDAEYEYEEEQSWQQTM